MNTATWVVQIILGILFLLHGLLYTVPALSTTNLRATELGPSCSDSMPALRATPSRAASSTTVRLAISGLPERCPSAHRRNNLADRLAGDGRRALVFDERYVLRVSQNPVAAIRRQAQHVIL